MVGESAVEVVVDVSKVAPQAQETLFEFGLMLLGEMAEEMAQQFALLVGKIAQVVEFVDVAQVGKYAVGVGHVLVDVVEVADEQLAPTIELVERLVAAGLKTERLVQVAHQLDGVGHMQLTLLAEQFADGDVGRAPQGLLRDASQLVVEKQRGALIGEYDSGARQVGAVLADNIFCNVF